MRTAAALSWRFVVVLVAVGVAAWIIGRLAVVTVPLAVAVLFTALLAPLVARLTQWKLPKPLATTIALLLGLAVLGGLLTLVGVTLSAGLPRLQIQVGQSVDTIRNWLRFGPLHVTNDQLQRALTSLGNAIRRNPTAITSGALRTLAVLGKTAAGFLLALFASVFFLSDGKRVWHFLLGGCPRQVRDRVDVAGRRAFASLVGYVWATVLVAAVDALGVAIGLLAVGIPLVVPLAVLVFLGAFVPIVGVVVTGALAVLIALVAKGVIAAFIVLAIVVAVVQLEGHVLQPLLLGRAVRLHPLAVVLGVATGLVVAGIAGALLAVPIISVLHSGVGSLLHDPPLDPRSVHPVRDRAAAARPVTERPVDLDLSRAGDEGTDAEEVSEPSA